MDSYDSPSLRAVTDEQMAVLVPIALEEFGPGLTQPQFNRVMPARSSTSPASKTSLVSALSSLGPADQVGSIKGRQFSRGTINGRYFEDAHVYRLAN